MKALFTIGVSASGKSTWAHEFAAQYDYEVVERDAFRLQHLKETRSDYDKNYVDWGVWKWKWESSVNLLVWEAIEEYAKAGRNLIIADTNLSPNRVEGMMQRLSALGYTDFQTKLFPIDFMEAVKRDAKRDSTVGFHVIAQQMQQYDKVWTSQYQGSFGRQKTVLVDIDGTLAEMEGRGPFDWNLVGNDKVKEEVRDVVRGLQMQGYKVVVLSGRDGVCFNETKTWLLQQAGLSDFDFYMRTEGDMRKDSIIKAELFWNEVAPKYDVKMVIDDRPQVTRMWRSIGLNVLQVGNPYVEF